MKGGGFRPAGCACAWQLSDAKPWVKLWIIPAKSSKPARGCIAEHIAGMQRLCLQLFVATLHVFKKPTGLVLLVFCPTELFPPLPPGSPIQYPSPETKQRSSIWGGLFRVEGDVRPS